MVGLADDGMLFKAKETLRVFAARRPSIRTLLDNRRQRFERAHGILPSTAASGEPLELTLQAWDQCERLIDDFEGTFRIGSTDDDAAHPDRVRFPTDNAGVATGPTVRFDTPGIQYLTLTHRASGDRFVTNPVRVTADPPADRLYWGDIHFHSRLSDGCGRPADGYRFGRDVMALDVVACTDHDTMGFFIPPRLQRRRMHRRYFDHLRDVAATFNDPGEFVTLFGYEWTKQPNVGGHINVYFDGVEDTALFDSMAADSDTYEKLFARLREFNQRGATQALAIPHHTAEATFPFDFAATDYDDRVAPLVEVYSQWGNSERPASAGNQHPVLMGQGEAEEPGHYVQDALRLGHRVGLMASSDYHGPKPGHSLLHAEPHLPALEEWRSGGLGWGLIWRIWNEPSYPGGLVAFRAPSLTREAIFESLRSRKVYGTSQPHRILLDFRIDGQQVGEAGSVVSIPAQEAPRDIAVGVAGTAPVESVTVVKNTADWQTASGTTDADAPIDAYTLERSWVDDEPVDGVAWDDARGTDADVYYVRVRQADGGLAWAGPLWVDVAE